MPCIEQQQITEAWKKPNEKKRYLLKLVVQKFDIMQFIISIAAAEM